MNACLLLYHLVFIFIVLLSLFNLIISSFQPWSCRLTECYRSLPSISTPTVATWTVKLPLFHLAFFTCLPLLSHSAVSFDIPFISSCTFSSSHPVVFLLFIALICIYLVVIIFLLFISLFCLLFYFYLHQICSCIARLVHWLFTIFYLVIIFTFSMLQVIFQ